MATPLTSFNSCPIVSRFVDTEGDARSYYAHKLVGDHGVNIKGVPVAVRFNPEEIHLFTEKPPCAACPGCVSVYRDGPTGEQRCFNRERARRLDNVIGTLERATTIHAAKMPGGRMVYGPAEANAQRMVVVIAPGGGGIWFVRTAYPVSAKAFAQAQHSGKPAPWPPK